jgi:serine/threonine protein kinase
MPQFGDKNAKKTKKTSSDTKRHFTVVMGNKEHGLYVSSTPSSAAKKAVTKLCAANKSKKVEFHIREITQGSKKKTYGPYSGYVQKLKEPIELKGRLIKYKPVAKLSGKSGAKKEGMMKGGGYDATLSVNKNILHILDSPTYNLDNTLIFTVTNKLTSESINYTNIRCLGEGGYGKVFLVANGEEQYVIKITKKYLDHFIKESTILDSFMNQVKEGCQYKGVSQGISTIDHIQIGHIIFPYKGGFELFNIIRANDMNILIPKILGDAINCLIDINKYACHGDLKLENIVYDDLTKTGFIIDFGLATRFPIKIESLYTLILGKRQLSFEIIIGYLLKIKNGNNTSNKIFKLNSLLSDLYLEHLGIIQKTIDNFGLFWSIIECISDINIIDEYIISREYLIHSQAIDSFDNYLNFYFNIDITETPLKLELVKLFNYKPLPNIRQNFIDNVFKKMSKEKFKIYFQDNRGSFNIFMENILSLIPVDPRARIPKEILLQDQFFQIRE